MQSHSPVQIPELALPKGGGALHGLGDAVGITGVSGVATLSVPLPVSAGRGFSPGLALQYSSGAGNGLFGIGWGLPLPAISRETVYGVPRYTPEDTLLGPSGERLVAERDERGQLKCVPATLHPRCTVTTAHHVQRYFAHTEGTFERVECWTPDAGGASFWLVQAADGTLHQYGRTSQARIADPAHPDSHIAQWLLEASLSVNGEQIRYEYASDENTVNAEGREQGTSSVLKLIRYGNRQACADLSAPIAPQDWHFTLLFSYTDAAAPLEQQAAWDDVVTPRQDAFCRYDYGFELRTRRLCRQVLMYHRFAELATDAWVLVKRMGLSYIEDGSVSRLQRVDLSGFAEQGEAHAPPTIFTYAEFDLATLVAQRRFTPTPDFPDCGTGGYQLADLYGEGVPGILLQEGSGWRYRAPQRNSALGGDAVSYADWVALPQSPVGQASESSRRMLTDFTGDAQLDWVITEPGMAGFFSQRPDKTWSDFTPFAAFPAEFAAAQAQLTSLVGSGYQDLVLIGPKSVRLYAGLGAQGFAAGIDVIQGEAVCLPMHGARDEVIAFSDMLGSGQQHVVRIRHNSVECWPHLGHGRFGSPIPLATGVCFAEAASFDPRRVFLADLDGSGAPDLIYAHTDYLAIYRNRSGNCIDPQPVRLEFPTGVQFDQLSVLQFADTDGSGCANLLLTLPQRPASERHWRFNFTGGQKPWLLTSMNNSQGLSSSITYRSSAQAWLDEKLIQPAAVCHLPFVVHTVASLAQHDEVGGTRLTQTYRYQRGYYDRQERKFRGFARVETTDTELRTEQGDMADALFKRQQSAQTPFAPIVTRTWYHQGTLQCGTDRRDYCQDDPQAMILAATLYVSRAGQALQPEQRVVMARALAGSVLRAEVWGMPPAEQICSAVLYSVSESRYRVELLSFHDPKAAVVMPQLLETLQYQYDGVASDPRCTQQINLASDLYGMPTHSVAVTYPRRLDSTAQPPAQYPEEWQQTWWRDSHDASQRALVLTELRQTWLHLSEVNSWRLGLAKESCSVVHEFLLDGGFSRSAAGMAWRESPLLSYEKLTEATAGNLLLADAADTRQMTGRQVQHYYDQAGMQGQPTLQGLLHHTESAELDALALSVYERLPEFNQTLDAALEQAGYHQMAWGLFDPCTSTLRMPDVEEQPLWGIQSDFCRYAPAQQFYRLTQHRPSQRIESETTFTYDRYVCQVESITDPLGQTTHAYYDYRTMQPLQLVDINRNTQEVVFDGLGRVLATTFYGVQEGRPVGFEPLYDNGCDADGIRQLRPLFRCSDLLLDAAIALLAAADKRGPTAQQSARAAILGPWASVIYYLPHSWRETGVATHTAVFSTDRYPADPAGQVRVAITYADGFGRAVQTCSKATSGSAYLGDAQQPMGIEQAQSTTHWLVSGGQDFNNKGLPIRTYQPRFLDTYRYVRDRNDREDAYCIQHDYDALGREVRTTRPDGYFRRTTYWPWYVITEDENDTAWELEPIDADVPSPAYQEAL
ncbi:SpvB/TcaC N-terminal domain-containing protein [Pseudomonas sp. NPDC079086]|uniref:SpvB/TcaC N-terminal domain-containing protein n=1 Tax=unclassified Pseudomonas TaxID=196821 RepID=UPI0037C63951